MPGRLIVVALVAAVAGVVALWVHRAARVWRAERDELTWVVSEPPAPPSSIVLREVHWELGDGTRQTAHYARGDNGAAIILAHGSPGTGLGMLDDALPLVRAGFGALLLDLPGYGASQGERSWGARYRESVRAAVDFLVAQPEVDATRIGALGYSMSTCTIAQAAGDDPRIRSIVLRAPYTRLDEQLLHQFRTRVPGVAHVAVWTARAMGVVVDELDTRSAMARLGSRPSLLVVGDRDGAIPLAMPRELQGLSPGAELEVLPGVGHVDIPETIKPRYFHRLLTFFRLTLGVEGRSAAL